MNELILKSLIASGPLAAVLGYGCWILWAALRNERNPKHEGSLAHQLQKEREARDTTQDKRLADQREWIQTATELGRLQHRAVKAIEDITGRKVSPHQNP